MSRRTTVERILRDDDDYSGQTVRSWSIRRDDPGSLLIRERPEADGFLFLRCEDVEQFVADLRSVASFSDPKVSEVEKSIKMGARRTENRFNLQDTQSNEEAKADD